MDAGSIMEARLMTLEGALQIVGLLLTVVSAHLTGLYFFIARAAIALRFVAFFGLTAGFVFMGVNAAALVAVNDALDKCDGCAASEANGSVTLPFGVEIAGRAIYEIGSISGFVLGGFLYLMLFVLTFSTGWERRQRPDA